MKNAVSYKRELTVMTKNDSIKVKEHLRVRRFMFEECILNFLTVWMRRIIGGFKDTRATMNF